MAPAGSSSEAATDVVEGGAMRTSLVPEQIVQVEPLDAPVSLNGTPFVPGGEFTVGAEDELLLVDAHDQLVRAGADDVVQSVAAQCAAVGVVSGELYAAELEFATTVCRDGEAVRSCLAASRAALARAGARAMAVGVHPAGAFGDAQLSPAPRYRAIGDAFAGLLRTPTAAFQVHVGVPDEAAAIAAYRGMRHDLAVLRALTAASPFWHGHDSGLASARWGVISSYPRGGVPPVVTSWEEYVVLAEAVMAAAEVPDYTHVWWDLRVQPRFGTVEVRVMDAQPSLSAAAGLTALVQGIARRAVEAPHGVDVPSAVLEENDFRAARHGLETRIVDRDGTMRPVRDLAAQLVAEARAVLAADGLDAPLDEVEKMLADEPAYVRQRRIHDERGMAALLADLTERTMQGR